MRVFGIRVRCELIAMYMLYRPSLPFLAPGRLLGLSSWPDYVIHSSTEWVGVEIKFRYFVIVYIPIYFRANGLLGNRNVYAGMAFNTETAIILVYYFLLYNSIAYVHGECTCK